MAIWAIVPAAGVGRRLGGTIPKQYLPLLGRTVIERSVDCLLAIADIKCVVVAIGPQDTYWQDLPCSQHPHIEVVTGGSERQESVLNALRFILDKGEEADWVLVHDAVRPCVRADDIEKLIAELKDDEIGGLLVSAMDNTVKRVAGSESPNRVAETLDRTQLFNALTPQMFRLDKLFRALNEAAEQAAPVTDEASAIERMGWAPLLVTGSKTNIKITHSSDLLLAEAILKLAQD
ncbi:2-C-methyl-D-erythritol 4-phosphate cytidylyltransferase [Gammaproteobacteria bacterium]|jgi:2-C-methyl-D-erythritol 4-phosphate cytidylyltransferase|nr:2-C-methyl-D-erythritol 4-phosphate cytidylyltransferase [Gammaproteobacteria bacterium]MDA7691887.1 2-C-methyl-D-erythritol 4-phosphate cytidylyltransferase [Gammaproteobacteria bacterium]MDA8927674.1 2-C-methyl-D-erythritol 4-phosphate cytidylyltransferase [Gammaproteobacteria bacterium]MDA9766221.1 2-C-methyl-D-erythritol 4-phosphate cytidylyltransferase [Gammaproteobacteria bacterium]MDB2484731.1 2-C-methyl-D-erythritol 4-phosphate cytidylyltransferase [Gammaproteobacteria bacterium]